MTQIRNSLPPGAPYVGGSDITSMVQALAVDLEQREHDDHASARDSAAIMRDARRDEIHQMRRQANAGLASGIVSSAAKAAQAAASFAGGTGDADGTSDCHTTTPPPVSTASRQISSVASAAGQIGETVTNRITADSSADQAAAKLRASTAEDARDAARESAKGAHDTIQRLHNAASEIERTRNETQRRILA